MITRRTNDDGHTEVTASVGDESVVVTYLPEDDDHEGRYKVKMGRYGEPFYMWEDHVDLLSEALRRM